MIFRIIDNGIIVLAGDKRGSSAEGKPLTDDLQKVYVVNRHLAYASAGNAAIGKAIELDTDKLPNKSNLTTQELLDVIRAFYHKLNETKSTTILALPFYFLIAGLNQKGEISLISGGHINGSLEANDVPMALYPPADVDMNTCCNICEKL